MSSAHVFKGRWPLFELFSCYQHESVTRKTKKFGTNELLTFFVNNFYHDSILEYTGYYDTILEYTGYYNTILEYTGYYDTILEYTGYFDTILEYTGYYDTILEYTG